jgi:cell division protein FtsB
MVILKILKNKYLLVIIGLFFWLLYFDRNDVFTQFDLIKKCDKLNSEKDYYIAEIENNKKEIIELQNNKESLETFAREKYLMKRDNEDVFIFVKK